MAEKNAKKHIRVIALLLLLFMTAALVVLPKTADAAGYQTIRVRLSLSGSSMSVAVKGDYYIKEASSLSIASGKTYTVSVSSGNVRISGNGIDQTLSTLTFIRKDGTKLTNSVLTIGGKDYLGDMNFKISSNNLCLTNTLDFEHYLYGVVAGEMGNSFPLEALKAQAVCARGYAIRKIDASTSSDTYDIMGSSSDQAYHGYNASYTKVIQAVDATKGQVLTYNGKIIEALYSAANGGQTELPGNAWGGGDAKNKTYAYLPQKDDPYDLEATKGLSSYEEKIFVPADPSGSVSGTYTYSNKVLNDMQARAYEALKGKYTALTAQKDLELIKINSFANGKERWPGTGSRCYTDAKANLTVRFQNGEEKKEETLDVTVVLMKPSGSTYLLSHDYLNSKFRMRGVETADKGWNVTNRRYGHGVGMSQTAAKVMANNYGKTYKDILGFYYVGAKLETKQTGTDGTAAPEPPPAGSSVLKIKGTLVTGIEPGMTAASFLKELSKDGKTYTLYNANSAAKTSGAVCTGDIVKSGSTSYSLVVYGDLNGDGAIDLTDLLREQKYLLGVVSLKNAYLEAADVTHDGTADISDLLRIQKYLLGVSQITQ